MGRFLTDTDYNTQIRTEILAAITQDQMETLLPAAELATMEEAEGYLAQRYDMATVWATTGTQRNPLLVMYMVDMTLYHIYSLIPNRQTPQKRETRYLAAKDYFERAAAGKVTLNLPRIVDRAKIPINIGATTELLITNPPADGDTVLITITGVQLTPAPIPLNVADETASAQTIVNAINLNANNTGFTAQNQEGGNFLISLPARLGHTGNYIMPVVVCTGAIQITASISQGGVTQNVDTSLDPERMRIGSGGRKFKTDSQWGP